ncbi:tetratricopeptide repeat protein [Roseofilum casamattae]|uniref:Tetratricopeptide repeat protein n=1 Tax=Roseofilum casamattae BLCC-M143 TaxID=3022442 RepID=A0ABT7BSR4_9CYAN|nr:tetratricopeptide repeat protein [Roseofilum casamattae]MDJ1182232.1 tetratricopeptide repeat protein [Roseofilum casamattae BLCC-M143]
MPSARAVETSGRSPNGRIVQAGAEAQLRRSDGREIPAELAMLVFPGDRLIATTSNILVQCSDLSWQEIPAGRTIANTCAKEEKKQSGCAPGSLECPDRGEYIAQRSSEIPYIISPRNTDVLAQTPRFRWHDVPGTKEYRVTLYADGEQIWQTTTSESEITYAGEIPLEPEVGYSLQVDADGGQSSLDGPLVSGGITFFIASEETRSHIQQHQDAIEAQALDAPEQDVALAHLYFDSNLVAEGIERLESAIDRGAESASIYRELGDRLFFRLSLLPQGKDYYEQAWENVLPDHVEEKAAIAYGLSQVYQAIGDRDRTIAWLTEAESAYQQLQDRSQLEQIREQLDRLQKP